MDFIVLFSSILAFILFVVVHALVFRVTTQANILRGLVLSLFLGMFLGIAIIFLLFRFFSVSHEQYYSAFPISFVLFLLLDLSYILGFFGMMASSLRVRILREIYLSKENQLAHTQLLSHYNKRIIVQERLKRLLSAGEVSRRGDTYTLVTRFSVFRIHHFLYVFFKKLYNVS